VSTYLEGYLDGPTSQPRRPKTQAERQLQASLVEFFSLAVAYGRDALLFAVPNGEKRDPATAAMLTGMSAEARENLAQISDEEAMRPAGQGVLPGAPDLIILLPHGMTLLVEVKVDALKVGTVTLRARGRQRKAQQRFQATAERLGQRYLVITSLEAFEALLLASGVPLRTHPISQTAARR
jgi:hypothetical protein